MKPRSAIRKAELALRKYALSLPEAYEEFPWGERALKVNKKVFVFMSKGGEELSLSTKLPHTGGMALSLPFAEPTAYGLGKSGWVSASFGPGDRPPIGLLEEWILESYRAVAPKRLTTALRAGAARMG